MNSRCITGATANKSEIWPRGNKDTNHCKDRKSEGPSRLQGLKNVTASQTSRDTVCSGPARGDSVPFLLPPLTILLRCFLNRAYCFKFCSSASLCEKRESTLRFIHIRTDVNILLLRFILCVTRVWLPLESRNTYLQVLISGYAFRYSWPYAYY